MKNSRVSALSSSCRLYIYVHFAQQAFDNKDCACATILLLLTRLMPKGDFILFWLRFIRHGGFPIKIRTKFLICLVYEFLSPKSALGSRKKNGNYQIKVNKNTCSVKFNFHDHLVFNFKAYLTLGWIPFECSFYKKVGQCYVFSSSLTQYAICCPPPYTHRRNKLAATWWWCLQAKIYKTEILILKGEKFKALDLLLYQKLKNNFCIKS